MVGCAVQLALEEHSPTRLVGYTTALSPPPTLLRLQGRDAAAAVAAGTCCCLLLQPSAFKPRMLSILKDVNEVVCTALDSVSLPGWTTSSDASVSCPSPSIASTTRKLARPTYRANCSSYQKACDQINCLFHFAMVIQNKWCKNNT